jgi:hypothetical protein
VSSWSSPVAGPLTSPRSGPSPPSQAERRPPEDSTAATKAVPGLPDLHCRMRRPFHHPEPRVTDRIPRGLVPRPLDGSAECPPCCRFGPRVRATLIVGRYLKISR